MSDAYPKTPSPRDMAAIRAIVRYVRFNYQVARTAKMLAERICEALGDDVPGVGCLDARRRIEENPTRRS